MQPDKTNKKKIVTETEKLSWQSSKMIFWQLFFCLHRTLLSSNFPYSNWLVLSYYIDSSIRCSSSCLSALQLIPLSSGSLLSHVQTSTIAIDHFFIIFSLFLIWSIKEEQLLSSSCFFKLEQNYYNTKLTPYRPLRIWDPTEYDSTTFCVSSFKSDQETIPESHSCCSISHAHRLTRGSQLIFLQMFG